MKFTKRQAFAFLLGLWLGAALLYQSPWVFSRSTTAKIYDADAVRRSGLGMSKMYAAYAVDGVTYQGSYFRNEADLDNHSVSIRYLIFSPGISRKNSFAGNWGYPIVFVVVLSLITAVLFIRKDIIANGAIFTIQGKAPFIRIENNPYDDYDVHDIDRLPGEAEQDLRKRLASGPAVFQRGEVAASVYKFNPNAILIFIIYLVLFFSFFKILLMERSVGPVIIVLGAVLVFVPLFVQNTNNPTFKAKIPDQGSLVFSGNGIDYKGEVYNLEDIEAVVVYLEAFRGFTYRKRTSFGKEVSTNTGDNNKVSCRCKGQFIDFTFILDYFSDSWTFKQLMATWSAKGVSVLLEKVFEDDFVLQEMGKFNTPAEASEGKT